MKVLYVSLIIRCDSAAIVENTSELLPDPDTPVKTVRRRLGISSVTFLRLFSLAPTTLIRSCVSAGWMAASGTVWLTVAPQAVCCRRIMLPARSVPTVTYFHVESWRFRMPWARVEVRRQRGAHRWRKRHDEDHRPTHPRPALGGHPRSVRRLRDSRDPARRLRAPAARRGTPRG